MQLHQIAKKNKDKKRIGRGGKRGTFSGRGSKGQKSRAGHKMQPAIRNVIKRYPKLRGYRFKGKDKNIAIVSLSILDKKFDDNEIVEVKSLIKKGIVSKIKGKLPLVKILANGDIKKKLMIRDCLMSAVAQKKIEKAGGKIL